MLRDKDWGFSLETPDGDYSFTRMYFGEMVHAYFKDKEFLTKLADLMDKDQEFMVAGIGVIRTRTHWLWLSPQRYPGRASSAVVKMTHSSFVYLRDKLRNMCNWSCPRNPSGFYTWGRCDHIYSVRMLEKPEYLTIERNWLRDYTWGGWYNPKELKARNLQLVRRTRVSSIQRWNSIPRALARKRQSHGTKTTSAHFLRCWANQLALITDLAEEPP